MFGKAVALALIGVIAIAALRQVKPELAVLSGIVAGVLIIFTVVEEITGVIGVFQGLSESTALNGVLFSTVVKIIGIGYITEYSAGICDDYGSSSLGKHVQLAGKVSIFAMAVPIIFNIIEAIGLLAG